MHHANPLAEEAKVSPESEEFVDLYDFAPFGYLTLSESGVIDEANLTAAQMLGFEKSSLLGQLMSQFVASVDHNNFKKHLRQLSDAGEAPPCELRMMKSDESVFWVAVRTKCIKRETGVPCFRVGFHDISARKELEAYRKIEHEVLRILNQSGDQRDFIGGVLDVLKARTQVDAVGIRLREGGQFDLPPEAGHFKTRDLRFVSLFGFFAA